MPSIKDLKKRISTVKNTQQTTRAMKMVSAAKLRRAQEAIVSQRPYARKLDAMIRKVVALQGGQALSPLVAGRREVASDVGSQTVGKRALLVVVSSDRGLCGGFNSNVIKGATRWIAANRAQYAEIRLAFVGKKAFDFYKSRKVPMGANYTDFAGKVSFVKARGLSEKLIALYLENEVDEIHFIFNEFKNAVTQRVVSERYLPLLPVEVDATAADEAQLGPVMVKPSAAEILALLLQKHFAMQAFRILLESQASEHGARMSAMENATKNAGGMLKKLTLQYNKQRQAGITKELLEIISGSESQKASA